MKYIKSILISLIVLSFLLLLAEQTSAFQVFKIRAYARFNDEIIISDVLWFNWDVVYIDTATYQSGEYLKEKYGLEFSVKPLGENDRMLFFRGDRLVRVINVDMMDIRFSGDRFYKNEKLHCQWEQRVTRSILKLYAES